MTELDKEVNLDYLVYRYIVKTLEEKFDKYDVALDLIDEIKNDEINLTEAKIDQMRLKLSLGEIKKRNKKN